MREGSSLGLPPCLALPALPCLPAWQPIIIYYYVLVQARRVHLFFFIGYFIISLLHYCTSDLLITFITRFIISFYLDTAVVSLYTTSYRW